MAKRVYESANIEATAAKMRELTGTSTQYTTYDFVDGVEAVYKAGRASGNNGVDDEIQEIRTLIEQLSSQKQDNIVFDGVYDAVNNKAATVNTVAEEVAKIIADAPEDFNSLKEVADWLETNGAEVAEMNSRINENASAIAQNKNKIEENTQLANTAQDKAANALTYANSAVNLATSAVNTADAARGKADNAVEIGTEANAKADRLAESKQDNLVFDGDYNAESNKVATVNTVASKIAEIVANAPADFDTLKEVADYIASDKTGATEINNKLSEHSQKIAENETAIADCVKNDDFATKDAAGVVKVNEAYGTRMVNGVLDLMPAQYSLIDSRSPNEYPLYLVNNGTRHQIVPANIDYAVKKVLSTDKLAGTAQAWTDEEKASARALLGIDVLIGDIDSALDELHAYAQSLINGGES